MAFTKHQIAATGEAQMWYASATTTSPSAVSVEALLIAYGKPLSAQYVDG
ncbi:hypothetical protein [Citrobacter portucalensis]